jgi:hypothetical protein
MRRILCGGWTQYRFGLGQSPDASATLGRRGAQSVRNLLFRPVHTVVNVRMQADGNADQPAECVGQRPISPLVA